jgi:hypothetical protein
MWYHRLSGDDVVGNEPIKAILIKAQVNYLNFFFGGIKFKKKKKTTREVYESKLVDFDHVKVHNYDLIKNFKT